MTANINTVVEEFQELSLEDQEYVSEIIQKQLMESRRESISRIESLRLVKAIGPAQARPAASWILWRTWRMIEAIWDQGFKRSYRKKIHRYPHLKKQFREKNSANP